jgi:putative SOS response-associated peptidase YedK
VLHQIKLTYGRRLLRLHQHRPLPQGGDAVTLLTVDPSADVAPIHDRQMVVLERADWSVWLEHTGNGKRASARIAGRQLRC